MVDSDRDGRGAFHRRRPKGALAAFSLRTTPTPRALVVVCPLHPPSSDGLMASPRADARERKQIPHPGDGVWPILGELGLPVAFKGLA